jgi:hypothetical protein
VLDKALALCGAAFGVLWRLDGGLVRAAAIRGPTPEYADFLTRGAYRPDAGSANGRLLAGASIVHQADVADTEDYRSGNELPRAIVELGGGRTLLAVALRREDCPLPNAWFRSAIRSSTGWESLPRRLRLWAAQNPMFLPMDCNKAGR